MILSFRSKDCNRVVDLSSHSSGPYCDLEDLILPLMPPDRSHRLLGTLITGIDTIAFMQDA